MTSPQFSFPLSTNLSLENYLKLPFILEGRHLWIFPHNMCIHMMNYTKGHQKNTLIMFCPFFTTNVFYFFGGIYLQISFIEKGKVCIILDSFYSSKTSLFRYVKVVCRWRQCSGCNCNPYGYILKRQNMYSNMCNQGPGQCGCSGCSCTHRFSGGLALHPQILRKEGIYTLDLP